MAGLGTAAFLGTVIRIQFSVADRHLYPAGPPERERMPGSHSPGPDKNGCQVTGILAGAGA
jgi:hypothetical protein